MGDVNCKRIEFVHEVNDPDRIEKNYHYINSLIEKAGCNSLEDITTMLDGLDGLERMTTSSANEIQYLVREEF